MADRTADRPNRLRSSSAGRIPIQASIPTIDPRSFYRISCIDTNIRKTHKYPIVLPSDAERHRTPPGAGDRSPRRCLPDRSPYRAAATTPARRNTARTVVRSPPTFPPTDRRRPVIGCQQQPRPTCDPRLPDAKREVASGPDTTAADPCHVTGLGRPPRPSLGVDGDSVVYVVSVASLEDHRSRTDVWAILDTLITPSPHGEDRSNGCVAQPSTHLFDRESGTFTPGEQVVS